MKTLKESILGSMGMGDVSILKYMGLDPSKVKWNKDGSIDYKGDIFLDDDVLIDGKFPLKFGVVKGHFNCSKCKSLTSLEGAPEKTIGYFNCSGCKLLKTLDGAPKEVRGNFNCSWCSSLISLGDTLKSVGGEFSCHDCRKTFTEEEIESKITVIGSIYNE